MPIPAVAPPIPGLSQTEGLLPGTGGPLEALASLLGARPPMPQRATGDKMAQVVQLLREIKSESPQLASLVGGALRALLEGPPLSLAEPSGSAGMGTPGSVIGGPGRSPY